MKKFTDTQKKWAMTATLVAALGCSVSFNPHKIESNADFSSTQAISDSFELDKKKIKVDYVANGKKTTAYVSGLECDTCASKYVIDMKLSKDTEDLANIQSELVSQITAQNEDASDEEEDSEEKSERRAARDEEREERRERAENARAEKKKAVADYKKIKDRMKLAYCEDEQDKSSCLSNEFLTLIEDNDFSEQAVYKYFTKDLEQNLIGQMMDQRPLDPRFPGFGSKGRAALDTLEVLLRDMPGEYESVKERLVFVGAEAIHRSASLQRNYIEGFATTGSMEDKLSALNQQRWTREMSQRLNMVINPQTIMSSVDSGEITYDMATAMYQNNYRVYADSITRGVELWTTQGQPVNLGAYTLPELQYANVAGLGGIQAPQVSRQQAPDLNARLGVARGEVVLIPQQTSSPVTAPQFMPNGVNFGTPEALTPQVQQQVQAIRPIYIRN